MINTVYIVEFMHAVSHTEQTFDSYTGNIKSQKSA